MIRSSEKPRGASVRLGERIKADIQERGLRPGDAYLTASEAAEMLGVSRATAHRAYQVLSGQGVLRSKRRAGTVVGEFFEAEEEGPVPVERIRILLVRQRIREGRFFDDLLRALLEIFPGREVSISYVPEEGTLGKVREVLNEDRDRSVGYILLGCPRQVVETISKTGLPAVVLGRTYPTARDMPTVSVNNRRRGYLLARHLLERGHERIGVMMPEIWLPGDTEMFDGVNDALSEFEISHGAMTLKNTPQRASAIEAEIRAMLDSPAPPTGLICKQRAVEMVEDSIRRIEHVGGEPISMDILVEVTDVRPEIGARFTHVASAAGLQERTKRAAEMLKSQLDGEPLEKRHKEYPVELVAVERPAA